MSVNLTATGASENATLTLEQDAIAAPSPNCGPRAGVGAPSLVVLHYTGMRDADAALTRLRDEAAGVSAHYMIDEAGRLYALVPESQRAWHAGVAQWRGERDVNSISIGIELVNRGREAEGGGPYHPYPEPQMTRLEALLAAIRDRWGLTRRAVVAHSDVAPERKTDPGEKFDWRRLGLRGLAIGPEATQVLDAAADEETSARQRFERAAGLIGYGRWKAEAVLAAFRRRFAPRRLGAPLDRVDAAAAEATALAVKDL